jgi:hypothetical protein
VPLISAVLLTWLVLTLATFPQHTAQAAPTGGVVGTGTPASCTEAALDARLGGGGTVTFNCGASPYTLTIASTRVITVNTTIDGGGKITLSGGSAVKIFQVNPGIRLTLNNLTVSNGSSAWGGCIWVFGGTLNATQTTIQNCAAHPSYIFSGDGGAIFGLNATIAMTDTTILHNSVESNGGGIYLYDGQATLNNVSILNNTANYTYTGSGGGVYLTATAQLTAYNSQISNNHIGYTGQGGGLYAYSSTLKLYNTVASNNLANNAADGGGLYVERGSVLVSGGAVSGNDGLYDGGGMSIQNARADLTGVTLDGNDASSNGGGLYAFQSTVNLTDVVISRNTAGSDGAGIHCYQCTGKFLRVTVDGNSATSRDGGGLLAYLSTLAIRDSTIRNNSNRYGGGIYNSDSTLTLDGVTLNSNTATSLGGGFYNEGLAYLTNATLSANTAITGGAIYNRPYANQAFITLTNVTVKDNSATDGGGLYNYNDANAAVYLKNTILADSLSGGNCKGKNIASAKYSISSDSTCILPGTGNHTNLDPLLTYLANNGGWTKTHLPKINSPAVDGVVGSDCPSVDQRGVARPQGASCDIGAVERASNDPPYPIAAYLPIVIR